jgi:hypothetical protein
MKKKTKKEIMVMKKLTFLAVMALPLMFIPGCNQQADVTRFYKNEDVISKSFEDSSFPDGELELFKK